MLNKAETSQEKEESLGIDERNIFFQKLYNTPDDEPWMHSPELTSALHPLSGPTELSPTSHTKPISTLHWQAIQWGKRNVDGLWLEAFCSLSAVQWALALPDSWQDFVMEMWNVWWAKQHKNTVPCPHVSQWFYGLSEDKRLSVCVRG